MSRDTCRTYHATGDCHVTTNERHSLSRDAGTSVLAKALRQNEVYSRLQLCVFSNIKFVCVPLFRHTVWSLSSVQTISPFLRFNCTALTVNRRVTLKLNPARLGRLADGEDCWPHTEWDSPNRKQETRQATRPRTQTARRIWKRMMW